jgi:hypothetical protein
MMHRRVLHDGKEFHVSETHFIDIIGQPGSEFTVAKRAVVFFGHPHPGTCMYFIDRDRSIQRVAVFTFLHPLLVLPAIVQVPDNGCGLGRLFAMKGKRIGLFGLIMFNFGF